VRGVALGEALRAGVVLRRRALLGLVDLQAQVGDDARVALVGHVDDARRADRVEVLRHLREAPRELVELEHVGVPADPHRRGVLRDGHRAPRQPADLAHVRLGPARLDVGDVEREQLAVDRLGDV